MPAKVKIELTLSSISRLQIFVLLLSMLVTLQQALSSGYINSVITTIEKRFDIPSSLSGLIASSYEIGNVITVIFVSYLGSSRRIPVWIGIGETSGTFNNSDILIAQSRESKFNIESISRIDGFVPS